jgi:uncharacterized surface protein with fasciclin (FAS1) repeats
MKLNKMKFGIMALIAFVLLAACDKRDQFVAPQPALTDNIITIAGKESNLSLFTAAAKRVGLETDLALLGNYTILAPTDAAFNAAGITSATIGSLSLDVLRAVLRNHIISGRVRSTDLLPGPNATYLSLQREILSCSFYNNVFYFNAKKVSTADIVSLNGVLHKVDGVLLPPTNTLTATAALNPNLSLFVAAVNKAGLASALNASTTLLTVFAPNNAAFIAAGFPDEAAINAADPVVLGNILRYHVLPASSLTSSTLTSPLNRAGRAFSVDFTTNSYATALGSLATVAVTASGSGVTVKGISNPTAAAVTTADILYFAGTPGANGTRPGVLHIIDKVLLP